MEMQQPQPIRILLVDDHAILRAGVRMLIETRPHLKVVAEAGSYEQALAEASREQPDLILLDLDLREKDGLSLLPELLRAAPKARVLVLTGVHASEWHRRAVSLGAMGIVSKEQVTETLLDAIEKVCAGEFWVGHSTPPIALAELMWAREEAMKKDLDAARIASLTPREREIIALVGEGLKNQQIADRLCITNGTVRNHLSIIFEKLDLSDRFGLMRYAYRHGLAKPV